MWWQTGVIYEIYPRSFQDSDGDGVGDLAGVIERLDYLADVLGVEAIWLAPFYPSPMADFGYDVADYCDVDPLFGDLATFDRLLEAAHGRGLRVIVDWVPNHTSDRHPWFLESRSFRGSAKRHWYVWRDPGPHGPPNNWLSALGGSAWEWDEATEQYYLHSFLPQQPDLNWRNPEVEEVMLETLRFWLDRGVDGFRVDVAHFVMKDPELRDNPPNPQPSGWMGLHPVREYDRQLHLYDRGHPDVHEVYRKVRRLLDSYRPDRVGIGEIHLFEWPEWVSYYGINDEFHLPFNFALLAAPWEAWAVRQVVDSLEAALPEGAWPNYVLGNHDEARLASRLGECQARVAALLLLTLRGTPTLYYGDELGMSDLLIPSRLQQDPFERHEPGRGRDGSRAPMPWDGERNFGFSSGKPWLPLPDDAAELNVAAQLVDSRSILSLYRRLLDYRRSNPALRWGTYRPLEVPASCFAYLRQAEGPTVLVALNFEAGRQHICLPGLGTGKLVLSSHLDRDGPVDCDDLVLRADEGVVVELG